MKPKITIKNVGFDGFGTGVHSNGPIEADFSNNTFNNVTTPYDLAPGSTGSIQNERIVNDPKLGFSGRNEASKRAEQTSSGWRMPAGPPMPSYCPKCQNIFPSKNYRFAGTFFTCWGNKEECPVCSFPNAELLEGTFDLSRETATILKAPDFSYEMLTRLKQLGADVAFGKLKVEEAIEIAESIYGPAGASLKKWVCFGIGFEIVRFFFEIVGGVDATWSMAQRLTDNNVVVDRVLESAFSSFSFNWQDYLEQPRGSIHSEPPTHELNSEEGRQPANEKAAEPQLPKVGPVPQPKPK
ncbi:MULTISPECIES: hypothetical protein [Rhizobium/Agrobacterium group]|uniref:Uncharacterized protein n=2 Tax=Rhizobium/Agrobacterium group TaxID=227290 RepID=B9JYC1_ALLAM|nr:MULTISPECIES: hypothetical protein [Rhizobium/Agrobacterium group]ACM37151.1 hypothetical protein Avi_2982 [Allorhizobium ampelinum S4]MUO29989.1 hypothetical protein [Agrobacterium vitis]MUO42353.1 hypothetical protein [Agrobacterium vitis]MUP10733.1 hypothetical protein [Agrobacterium vitis]